MAEITRERSGQIVRKVFEILLPHPDGLPAREVLARAAREMTLTDFEKSSYPDRPNDRRFEKILRFSTITSVKAGWLTKNRGQWSLTEEGRAAFSRYKDPVHFMREARRLYKEWERDQPEDEQPDSLDTPGPSIALEEAEEAAWTEIEAHLGKTNPYDFQELVAGLLKGMGYHVSWVAPAGPDKGVDIIAYRDPLGIEGGRIRFR